MRRATATPMAKVPTGASTADRLGRKVMRLISKTIDDPPNRVRPIIQSTETKEMYIAPVNVLAEQPPPTLYYLECQQHW